MAVEDALISRINNPIGLGKLYLRVGETKVFIWGGWTASRPESSRILGRIGTKYMFCVSVSHSMVLMFS